VHWNVDWVSRGSATAQSGRISEEIETYVRRACEGIDEIQYSDYNDHDMSEVEEGKDPWKQTKGKGGSYPVLLGIPASTSRSTTFWEGERG
jgi:hypothetical protein